MKNYRREIGIGLTLIILFGGLILWFVKHEPEALFKIGIAAIAILVGITTFIRKVITTKRDLESGAPPEDEFSKYEPLASQFLREVSVPLKSE